MALFLPGMLCSLCEKPMNEDDNIISFPAMMENPADELYFAYDATFHRACLEKHSSYRQLMDRLAIYHNAIDQPFEKRHECVSCHTVIVHYDEYMPLGFFTCDPANPLYVLNYRGCHKNCLQPGAFSPEMIVELQALLEAKEIALGKIAELLARTAAPKAEEAKP